jgi:hypothetical protein
MEPIFPSSVFSGRLNNYQIERESEYVSERESMRFVPFRVYWITETMWLYIVDRVYTDYYTKYTRPLSFVLTVHNQLGRQAREF